MELQDAIKHAIDGEAILFLGAGFSIGGKNKNNDELPTADELSRRMCRELGLEESNELSIVSDRFIDDPKVGRGVKALICFLKKELYCISTSEVQDDILKLPWMRVYTTNYDNIIEISSEKMKIDREVITATLPRRAVTSSMGAIVHMNGFIKGVDEEKFYNEFKISNSNYLKEGFLDSCWGGQFVKDINNCKAIIFVGYSMKYDLELQKIMNGNIKEKAVFVDRQHISEEQAYIFGKWGKFCPIGAVGLMKEINRVSKEYKGVEKIIGFKSIEEMYIDKYTNIDVKPNDVINLLVYGKCNKYDFRNKNLFMERKQLLATVRNIISTKKICLIHSNLGNGKSIALYYLASRLIEDYRVYFVKDINYIQEDIELIKCRRSQMHIIFLDDYDMQFSVFRELSYDFPDNIKIIATSRSSMSDMLFDSLVSEYGVKDEDIGIVNIEIISKEECEALIDLLDNYNLWGNRASYSRKRKRDLVSKDYKNRLSSIFYLLLNSDVIYKKVNHVLEEAKNNEVSKYLYAQAVCDICNFKLRGFQIAFIADIDFSEINKAALSKNFKEVFIRTSDDIELRSSIFSQYLIRQEKQYKKISSLLSTMYRNAYKSQGKEFDVIIKKMISRSNLIEIFGGKRNNIKMRNRDNEIYNFYCSIQRYAKENPFFWLQFAITSLNLNYYDNAKIYFENAYSYADGLENFDSFQLDTHYARFLLEEMVRFNKKLDFENLTKAHRLLMDNSNAEIRLAYVLRQVGIYKQVNELFKSDFEATEYLEFIEFIKEIVGRFNEYFEAIERKKSEIFYFAIDKSVRKPYKEFRKLLLQVLPDSEVEELDKKFNKLVKYKDRVRIHKNSRRKR